MQVIDRIALGSRYRQPSRTAPFPAQKRSNQEPDQRSHSPAPTSDFPRW